MSDDEKQHAFRVRAANELRASIESLNDTISNAIMLGLKLEPRIEATGGGAFAVQINVYEAL